MTRLLFAGLFIASCTSQVAMAGKTEAAKDERRTMAVGTVEVLEFPEHSRLLVGNAGILHVDAVPEVPTRWRVIPLKAGETTLEVSDPRGRFIQRIHYRILSNEMAQNLQGVRRMLASVAGATVESVGDKIVIDGEILDPRDMDRILKVQAAYGKQVVNLATLNRGIFQARAELMEREIQASPGASGVKVAVANETYILYGEVDHPAERERAEVIAQTYLPEVMGSPAIREGVLVQGAKKVSIRNLIVVRARKQ